jgi:L-amino acid N-acyltransferase YncA
VTTTRIAAMTAEHADQVLAVYQAGLDTGNASFEVTAPEWSTWDANHLAGHRHVALADGGAVIGFVAASAVSSRRVYAGVVEHSVYVAPAARGLGVGGALLDALIASTEAAGIWTIQAGLFPENHVSRALHRRHGFREQGIRHHVGNHHGRWRDVVMMERRSTTVGT